MTQCNYLPGLGDFLKHTFLAASMAALLAACGGGNGQSADALTSSTITAATAKATPSFLPTSSNPPSEQTIAQQKEGARLNSEELAQIAKTGVLPKAFEGPLLSGAEKVVASSGSTKIAAAISPRTAVYRFFNTKTNAHFFTTSTTERDNVQATLPFMSFEGPAFYAAATAVPGLSPVHRFYNIQTGVHFYTISESERALVAATLPQFTYEGIAYYASTLPGTGYTPLYRFFYTAKGFHFYTNSQSERDNIIATLPQYSYEGVGYYVLGSDWQVPAIPHSGITSAQCYQAGSDTLVSCASAGALALNPQQDGHRAAINPMSYGGVPGHKPLDSCVLDQVTGLIWEVKTASGVRSGTNTYTNLGNSAATDSSGYVAAINAMQLCGFNDWRIPTREELMGLVDFGATGSGPRIRMATFPNTSVDLYWASDVVGGGVGAKVIGVAEAWYVGFGAYTAISGYENVTSFNGVRLVRGAAWTGQRYVLGSDNAQGTVANNVVTDRRTGLTWSRCVDGKTWNGSTCTGLATAYSQELAMAHAATTVAGWRLPNAKELASLADLALAESATDSAAFPGLGSSLLWSSTPYSNFSSNGVALYTGDGPVYTFDRGSATQVLFVKIDPLP